MMFDCLKFFIFYNDNGLIMFWGMTIVKIVLGIGIAIIGTDFLIHVWRRKTIPSSKLSNLASTITIFYVVATWIEMCQFPPVYQIYYSIFQQDSTTLDDINEACNIDLEHAVAMIRGVFTMFGGVAYVLTFVVYYIRLQASFEGSFYQITKCTTRFFWTIIV